MKNLKRYDLKLGFDGDNNAYAQMMLRKYGRYVKFFDGEEISKTSINKLKAKISVCENRILEYVKFVSGKDDELLDIANELRKLTAVE